MDKNAIPVLDINNVPVNDTWGNPEYVDAAPISDRRCLFVWKDTQIVSTEQTSIQRTPTLYVPFDDPINEEDEVYNVVTQAGVVLIKAAVVKTVDKLANFGDVPCKCVYLTGVETV